MLLIQKANEIMKTAIKALCEKLSQQFDSISEERKQTLQKISKYIQAKKDKNEAVNLLYVCTHNSRRSHFGQVWGAVAGAYYNVPNLHTFSGGTEATAFNPNAIAALRAQGFDIEKTDETQNPLYLTSFSDNTEPIRCFSKVFDDKENPSKDFVAIMVCGDAEENCPFVPGVDLRVLTSYADPKDFDGTLEQDAKYQERSLQIGLESLYMFSLIQ